MIVPRAARERAGHQWLGVGPARRPFFNMLQAWKHSLDRYHCCRRALTPMSLLPTRWQYKGTRMMPLTKPLPPSGLRHASAMPVQLDQVVEARAVDRRCSAPCRCGMQDEHDLQHAARRKRGRPQHWVAGSRFYYVATARHSQRSASPSLSARRTSPVDHRLRRHEEVDALSDVHRLHGGAAV